MLNDNERGLPRRVRRAILSDRRTIIKKRTPFGRTRVMDFQTPPDWLYEKHPVIARMMERTQYLHFTKGRMDRRTTIALLDNLVSIG